MVTVTKSGTAAEKRSTIFAHCKFSNSSILLTHVVVNSLLRYEDASPHTINLLTNMICFSFIMQTEKCFTLKQQLY